MRQDSPRPRVAPGAPAFGRIFSLARGVFAAFGFAIAVIVALPQTRDGLLNQFHAVAWRPVARVAAIPATDAVETGGPRAPGHAIRMWVSEAGVTGVEGAVEPRAVPVLAQQDAQHEARATLTQYIASRYRVADEIVARIVEVAFHTAELQSLDPLVVLAVVATESSYNPIAESVVGAKGLMQVIAKFHPEKLAGYGGEDALFEPEVNIRVGTQILREYLRRYGDLEIALQVYAGALEDADARYARKVFAERERLQQALERPRREA